MAEPPWVKSAKLILTYVTKGRVPHVVAQCDGFREVFVQIKRPGDGAGYLSHFQRVCQACDVMVAERRDEYLCLMFEATECFAM